MSFKVCEKNEEGSGIERELKQMTLNWQAKLIYPKLPQIRWITINCKKSVTSWHNNVDLSWGRNCQFCSNGNKEWTASNIVDF